MKESTEFEFSQHEVDNLQYPRLTRNQARKHDLHL